MRHVAIIGGAGVGKTTLARELIEHHGFGRHSWADPVRSIFALAYGDPGAPGSEEYAETKRRFYDVTDPHGYPITRTGRDLLQRIGTDAIREHVDLDFWVKVGVRLASESKVQLVNDDTRFPNEARFARKAGWLVVRLDVPPGVRSQRLGITVEALRSMAQHDSERLIPSLPVDHVLDGRLPPPMLAEKVATLAS